MFILLKRWFSRLPRNINSYTSNLWSSSQQYPINLTRLGCLSCPRKFTSVLKCKIKQKRQLKISKNKQKLKKKKSNEWIQAYKPFSMTLKTFLVKDFDSDRKRFKANPDIFINVTFIDSAKPSLAQNVIGAEALCDGLKLIKGKWNDMGIKHGILSRILEIARRWGIAQIWYWAMVILLLLTIFNRQRR